MSGVRRAARPFAVEVGGAEGLRIGGVVDERDDRRRDFVAEAIGEQRAPLMTASPVSVAPMMPSSCAVTHGSSTTVRRSAAGLVAPNMRVARSTASRGARPTSSVLGARPTENPKPVVVSSPSAASE